VLAGLEGELARPMHVEDTPWILERAVDRAGASSRHNHYIIKWPGEVESNDGSRHSTMFLSIARAG